MAKSTIISNLEELYKPLDNKWVNQNSLVINYAKGAGLSVGGSIAMAISNRKPHKIPGDFDFFTDNNENALKFIQNIIFWLSNRPNTHYKIQFNNKTEFTLPGVSHHVRITVPFWKSICVMTLENPIRSFFYHGLKVQYFDDVVQAAKEATAKDGKNRITFDEEEARANIRNRFNADGTYDITCDSTNNSSEDIRNNRVNANVTFNNGSQIRNGWDRITSNNEICLVCGRPMQTCANDTRYIGLSSNHNISGIFPTERYEESVDTGENVNPSNEQSRQVLGDIDYAEYSCNSVRSTITDWTNELSAAARRISEARRNGPAIEFPTLCQDHHIPRNISARVGRMENSERATEHFDEIVNSLNS